MSFGRGRNRVTLNYDPINQRWNNKDGNAYTGSTNKFAENLLADLKKNQENMLGNFMVLNLSLDKKEHNIIQGDVNDNKHDLAEIFYNGPESSNDKILEGGNAYYAEGYVVLGHEMAHKFSKNLGIKNYFWFVDEGGNRGVDEYNAMYYENILRKENGLKLRMYYDYHPSDGFRGQIIDSQRKLWPMPNDLLSQHKSLPLFHALIFFLGFKN